MKKLSDWIDKERVSQEIKILKSRIQSLNKVLRGGLEGIKFEVVYHNSDVGYGQYFPEDDYYLSIVIDYSDNYVNKLIAADEILKEESGYGQYESFMAKCGGVIISPFVITREEFLEIVQTENSEEIRQLIQEIYKISRRLKSANDTIDKSSRMLDLQKKFKVEFQDKEKIEELKEGLAKITKLKNELIAQLQIRKEELKQKFGIDIEELQSRIQRTR